MLGLLLLFYVFVLLTRFICFLHFAVNSGVFTDYTHEPHAAKRVKSPKLEDMLSGSEGEEEFLTQLHIEADAVRKSRGQRPYDSEEEPEELVRQNALREGAIRRLSAASEEAKQLGSGPAHSNEDDDLDDSWDAEGLEKRFQSMQSFSTHEAPHGGSDKEKMKHQVSDDYYAEKGRDEVDLTKLSNVELYDLADGDLGFKDFLTLIRDSTDGTFDDIELDGKLLKTKSSRQAKPEPEPKTYPEATLSEQEEVALALAKYNNLENEEFEDIFAHCSNIRGSFEHVELDDEDKEEKLNQRELALAQERRMEKLSLLDAAVSKQEHVHRGALAALAGDSRSNALAIGQDTGDSEVTFTDVTEGFDMVYFGRPPNADYSLSRQDRCLVNMCRAELALKHMVDNGLQPSAKALAHFVGVFTEGTHIGLVDKQMSVFEQFNVRPDAFVYEKAVVGYVRAKNVEKADEFMKKTIALELRPTSRAYGVLIEAHTHRGNIVEGLKLLEDATKRNVKVPEGNLKQLRARCETLGIKHPDMPPNPVQWVKDVKLIRRRQKMASQRVIEPIRSAFKY